MEKLINVMWLCSKPTNEYLEKFNKTNIHYGGWIDSILSVIRKSKKIHIDYVFFVSDRDNYQKLEIDKVNYYPVIDFREAKSILDKNDILHVFGTENKRNNDFVLKHSNINTVVWLQGIVSECAKCYLNGINDVIDKSKISNGLLTKLVIFINYLFFKHRQNSEIEVLKKIKYVIGRTDFDRRISLSLNPKIVYFYCQEALRDNFYDKEYWNNTIMKPHSIYISQAGYPIKGFHTIISSLGDLVKVYPDISIRIGGENLLQSNSILTKIGINYASLIKKLLLKNNLLNNVEFIGTIGPELVKKELLNSNLSIICSSIENGCNALREALITGTPIVSADIEGVKSSEINKFINYYINNSELKEKIENIFDGNISSASTINQVEVANRLYDRNTILNNLEKIYLEIYEGKNE